MKNIYLDYAMMNPEIAFSENQEEVRPEVSLVSALMAVTGVPTLFSPSDIRELIFRIWMLFGNSSEQNQSKPEEFEVAGKVEGEEVQVALSDLHLFKGLTAIPKQIGEVKTQDFIAALEKNRNALFQFIAGSNVEIKGLLIGGQEVLPQTDISEGLRSAGGDLANASVRNIDEQIFADFNKYSDKWGQWSARLYKNDPIFFDVLQLPFQVIENCMEVLCEGYGYDKELLRKLDEDEFYNEFRLIEVAWAFANGFALIEYSGPMPVVAWFDVRVELDDNLYEGLQLDDLGGLNLLTTYQDYELEKLAGYLKGQQVPVWGG